MPPKESAIIIADITYGDLRLVNCGGCRCTLLGESHEWIRRSLIGGRVRRRASRLPPPVAMRAKNGMPLCATCTEGTR